MIDYRKLRLNNINTPEFSHLLLLLFWPVEGLVFAFLERGVSGVKYNEMYCRLDDYIPFNEYFVIAYYFWFVFLFGIILYSLLWDIPAFKRYMWFTIITYTITLIIYIIYPSEQVLRPETFASDNIFTRIVAFIYSFDTNTNVCPSLHVIGAIAVLYASWNSKWFHSIKWRIAFLTATILISMSTVFLKQHSIVDVFASLIVCAAVYLVLSRTGVNISSDNKIKTRHLI